MDELIRIFNKKRKLKKTLSTAAIVAGILVEITSFILFIIFVVQGDDLANIFGVLFLVLPVLALIVFFVSAFKKDKLETQLYDALEKGNFSAEEILLIGEKINVNLFSKALSVRCKELGLESIPEWCVRDGVLPTKKDVE